MRDASMPNPGPLEIVAVLEITQESNPISFGSFAGPWPTT